MRHGSECMLVSFMVFMKLCDFHGGNFRRVDAVLHPGIFYCLQFVVCGQGSLS